MRYLTHEMLNVPSLCVGERDHLARALTSKRFTPRRAVKAYLATDGCWTNVVRAYQALVNAKALPNVGLVWKIARLAFRELPKDSGLRQWATKLSAKNYGMAYDAIESEKAEATRT